MRIGSKPSVSGAAITDLVLALAFVSMLVAVFAPAALQKRIAAHEVVALGGMKSIFEATAAFRSVGDEGRYPADLAELRAAEEPFLEPLLASGTKAGYVYTYAADSRTEVAAGFTAEAHPIVYRREGVRSYFIDESGRLRAQDIGGFPGHPDMQPLDSEEEVEP
jgi:hypothetical protein